MSQVVLIVEKNDRIRAAIRQQFLARNVPTYDVSDAFDAMSALGRAEFGAIVAAAGKRQLSLRGLCQLARRRHPSVHIFVIVTQKQAADVEQLESAVGVPGLKMVPPETTTEQLAARVIESMSTPFSPTRDSGRSPSAPSASTSTPTPTPTLPSAGGAMPQSVALPNIDIIQSVELPDDEDLLPNPGVAPAPAPAPVPVPEALNLTEVVAQRPATLPPSLPVDDDDGDLEAMPLEPLAEGVVLEGALDGRVGAALLMSLSAQQFTGSLEIDRGPALGQLFLYEGAPVWANHPDGDAQLFAELVGKGHLPPDLQLAPVPAGQLLGHLTQMGHLSGKKIYAFMLEYVRGRVMSLIAQEEGGYRFVEDPAFLEVAPLLKVNPFGLVLASKRRTMTPDRLLALSSEYEWKFLYPLPQLAPAVEDLKPFSRGLNVAELLSGGRTVRSFCQKTGLDDLMGLLVVLSMLDARLVTLEEERRENTNVVLRQATNIRGSTQPSAEGTFDQPIQSVAERQAQDQLMRLYMQLKPLTQPTQVLGIAESNVTEDEIRSAYKTRMAALDPKLIPEGSAQAILKTQVSELRVKVENAYQALIQMFP